MSRPPKATVYKSQFPPPRHFSKRHHRDSLYHRYNNKTMLSTKVKAFVIIAPRELIYRQTISLANIFSVFLGKNNVCNAERNILSEK